MSRHIRPHKKSWFVVALVVAVGGAMLLNYSHAAVDEETANPRYEPAGRGVRWIESGNVRIKMLVDQSNLGGSEIEIGEITLPVSYGKGPPHLHQSTEIFYVLSGKLGHTVKGELHVLEPGMVGIVRSGDAVSHSVESDEPVKALVIWTPGGESEILLNRFGFKARPIEDE